VVSSALGDARHRYFGWGAVEVAWGIDGFGDDMTFAALDGASDVPAAQVRLVSPDPERAGRVVT
jgi:hypothetical protein